MNFTSIRISKSTRNVLKKLATESGKSQTIWLDQAVYFLNKTGHDIFNFEKTNKQSVEDRIISFMKKREQNYFDPMEKYFVESRKLLSQVLQGLEDFGIVEILKKKEEIAENNVKKLKPISEQKTDIIISAESQEKEVINDVDFNEESDYKLRLEISRLKSENMVYKNELEFLVKNIKPGGALSNTKFVINIISKDILRIKKLLT